MSRKAMKTSAKVEGGGNILTWQADNVNHAASPGSFSKGEEIVNSGSVLSAAKSPSGVVGSVRGSDYTPYSITISLDGSASCSCPDRRGGWCKHSVAVMLSVIRSNPGAAIAASSVPSYNPFAGGGKKAAARPKRAAATKKSYKDDDDFVDDDDEESSEEESEEDSEEEEIPVRKTFTPKAKVAAPAVQLTSGLFGAPTFSTFTQTATISAVTFGTPTGAAVPVLTDARLVFQAPAQLPFQPQLNLGHGTCGDCRRGAHGGVRCKGCSFSLCADCEVMGRCWHHMAMMGAGHTFA